MIFAVPRLNPLSQDWAILEEPGLLLRKRLVTSSRPAFTNPTATDGYLVVLLIVRTLVHDAGYDLNPAHSTVEKEADEAVNSVF